MKMERGITVSDTLTHLFNPRSIAVVGASDHEGKPGNIVFNQLLGNGFRVFPVSVKETTVRGIPAYRSVGEVPEVPDMAVLAIPAEAAVAVTRDCVDVGMKVVIVVAGGFGETCSPIEATSSNGRTVEIGRARRRRGDAWRSQGRCAAARVSGDASQPRGGGRRSAPGVAPGSGPEWPAGPNGLEPGDSARGRSRCSRRQAGLEADAEV